MTCDIAIVGGGIAGLIATCALGRAGYSVICVDPSPPDQKTDLRSTAFLQPARRTLETAGLWAGLAPHATALQVMRLADADAGTLRVVADFDAAEMSDHPFGWNIPNTVLRAALAEAVAGMDTATHLTGRSATRLTTRSKQAILALDGGDQIRASLVIGADGRDSFVRTSLGIDHKRWSYGQQALVCALSHGAPHDGVSVEVHHDGGPFTLVPLPDREGKAMSALVWMDHGPKTHARLELDVPAFEAALLERSCGVFGPLHLAGPRQAWPIISQQAARLTGQRALLMAEAAHVVPPIGAQGLNMSLADLHCLLGLLERTGTDPGDPDVLSAFERARFPDMTARVRGVDLLNRASIAGSKSLRDLRAQGLRMLGGITPLRRAAMAAGLGSMS